MRSRKKKFTMDDKFARTKVLPGISPLKLNKSLVAGESFARRAGSGPLDTGDAMDPLSPKEEIKTYINPKDSEDGNGKNGDPNGNGTPTLDPNDWDGDGIPNTIDNDPGEDPSIKKDKDGNVILGPQTDPNKK